jgi:LmbE family N-acetylglucosaminyl deacetylase
MNVDGARDAAARATAALIREEQRRLETFLARRVVPFPPATRVLMVAPHPDDNLFGPGGTALKYVAAGIPVHWCCVTDGRACVAARSERTRMAGRRAAEERAVARFLGVGEPELYAIPEDELATRPRQDEAVARLAATFARERPDALFVPWFLDLHPLHRLVCHLAARALERIGFDVRVCSWALGAFPPPTFVVDVAAEMERKRAAARLYASQQELRDYVADIDFVAAFHARAYGPPDASACEIFFAQPRADFVADVLSRELDSPEALATGAQPVLPEDPAR